MPDVVSTLAYPELIPAWLAWLSAILNEVSSLLILSFKTGFVADSNKSNLPFKRKYARVSGSTISPFSFSISAIALYSLLKTCLAV